MRMLDKRGTAALEFCLVAVPLFTLMFVIFDLGRYAITMQSLRALANAGARTMMISNCYVNAEINKTPPSCTGDPLPTDAAKQAVAPFLYVGGLTPTLAITQGAVALKACQPTIQAATALTVTACQPSFTMLMPIWNRAFDNPSASTSVPF
jgi:hypothetical protein